MKWFKMAVYAVFNGVSYKMEESVVRGSELSAQTLETAFCFKEMDCSRFSVEVEEFTEKEYYIFRSKIDTIQTYSTQVLSEESLRREIACCADTGREFWFSHCVILTE